ncbi:hypothetical protein ABZO31_00270 [Streptomyces sp. HUAS MG47]|uniref:hypothetical protein n=1 Tax=Streptomyces solicamelliae TaxID=3231716 RepID=UPI003877EBD0
MSVIVMSQFSTGRVVKVIADGRGAWRLCEGGAESVHRDLGSAVGAAELALTGYLGGGVVEIHHADGRVEQLSRSGLGLLRPPPQVAQTSPPSPDTLRGEFGRVRREKKYADWAVDHFLELIWPALLTLLGPVLAGAMADDVAAQRGVFGVFWATLAWSSGVALFVFVLSRKLKVGPVQHFAIATACLLGGSFIAVGIGHGAYGVEIAWGQYGTDPWEWPLPVIDAAIVTFGWAGALLGGVCGAITGGWAARLYEKATG